MVWSCAIYFIGYSNKPIYGTMGKFISWSCIANYNPLFSRFLVRCTPEWLSRDPSGEGSGINLYGYVENRPINLLDPLGLFSVCAYAKKMDNQALPAYTGQCGHYVGLGLKAGGAHFEFVDYAKDYGAILISIGFTEVSSSGYTPMMGDTYVFNTYPGQRIPAGHIEMYDGTQYVSDTKQPGFWANHHYQKANDYKIYRAPN